VRSRPLSLKIGPGLGLCIAKINRVPRVGLPKQNRLLKAGRDGLGTLEADMFSSTAMIHRWAYADFR